ncbi:MULTISPECIES: hypothetical protein [Paenibacillus]|uniref:Uncharacterized protein n=1 Tax=Paenibacillus pabuli TaxID=1472 RepID=A0A855XT45_9BACL|nr:MULTISPECIES: hypothetical protein [Paenibacillus]PWW37340.1 hypothetical protein DET56_109226 [Paenibacillus pabuli]PXW05482.1 hypothetical protein DEU73_108225 [Paenibacillus taichungensis]
MKNQHLEPYEREFIKFLAHQAKLLIAKQRIDKHETHETDLLVHSPILENEKV